MMQERLLVKRRHLSKLMDKAKRRAERLGLPFDLTLDYLTEYAPEFCPVFGTQLLWGPGAKVRPGKAEDNSPSIDRLFPEKGYVKGNVAVISNRANSIKSNATYKELYKVADWLHTKEKEITSRGYARPPSYVDPAFTYVGRPTHVVVVNDARAREEGGY
jgi:hypothetical protein